MKWFLVSMLGWIVGAIIVSLIKYLWKEYK